MSRESDSDESIIRHLPPEISNKIAAGEVIQRPSSVVKELLDNAIDSGADQIKIYIQNAGRTLIQVSDDGCGMAKGDIRPCFQRHATSKIQQVEDLQHIRTMGFRGEAMASIASVSQVTLKTKRVQDEVGHKYEIWGGEERTFEPASTDDGTSVEVRNLFYNVPARRQFLKTDATEFRHILRVVQQVAIANTDIGFYLTADADDIYELPPQPIKERITEIFGKNYRASLIEVEEETSYVDIYGVLGDPKLTKKSRGEQFLFVNGRPFQHNFLKYVTLNIYDTWTGPKEYPFFAIFLELDPTQVDVNVHPSKMEVKFEDERSIIQLTKSVVKKAINEYFMVPDVDDSSQSAKSGQNFPKNFRSDMPFSSGSSNGGQSGGPVRMPSRINRKSNFKDGKKIARSIYEREDAADHKEGARDKEAEQNPEEPDQQKSDKGFWQLHNAYIVTQTRSGMCMIDQYRAHKRIIYEKTLEAAESSLPSTQQLLFSQTVELSATDFSLLEELQPEIQRMGFNVELMSGNTAMVQGVPADIDIGDEQSVLKSVLHQYQQLDQKVKLGTREKLAVAFASKAAVNRGRSLSKWEMETLIDQLFACENPYKDPLDNPTLIYFPLEEIESRFS